MFTKSVENNKTKKNSEESTNKNNILNLKLEGSST
jgi:hypothetical protein